jgi:hypothetical protein
MEFPMSHAGQTWSRLTSGIEAGVVGGAAMLGMLISESLWSGHVWWEVPNLLGSTFYGARALRLGTGLSILAGTALHFVITGTLGGLFGLACGGIHQRGRLVLFGVLAAVGWYNIANTAFWPRVNPWVPLASPRPATMFSYVLLGACLGYMGQRQKAPAADSPAVQSEPTEASMAEPPEASALRPAGASLPGPVEASMAGAAEADVVGSDEASVLRPAGASLPGPAEASVAEPIEASAAGPAGTYVVGSDEASLAGPVEASPAELAEASVAGSAEAPAKPATDALE